MEINQSSPDQSSAQHSYTGAKWQLRKGDDSLSLHLQQKFSLQPAIADMLAARGFTPDEVPQFLNPKLRDFLPDPFIFLDMEKAVQRIYRAISTQEKIAILGDYDVDGATSSALWLRFMEKIGVALVLYIPDRIKEGYGPSIKAMDKLVAMGVKLVITVDCGISAYDALAHAAKIGLEVIVLDHHQASGTMVAAHAIVNPNRLDQEAGYGHLAAVGVCYLTLIALHRLLRETAYYQTHQITPPDLLEDLDLVALGTVCDMVSLTGLNRAFVAQGLKIMGAWRNSGLKAMAGFADIYTPTAGHCGFQFGPRVNAGGRVGESSIGARLLSTHNGEQAQKWAMQLDHYNQARKEIEQACLADALNALEEQEHPFLITVAQQGWHSGVIGIVAGRLKEQFHRPTIVIALDDQGIGKGSARSIEGVDIGTIIMNARDQGLLINGGGHAMAAGITIAEENINIFNQFMEQAIKSQLQEKPIIAIRKCDGLVHPAALNLKLCDQLEQLAPFGIGNAEPRYCLYNAKIAYSKQVGENHIAVTLKGEDGGYLKAIAFRALDFAYGEILLNAKGGMPLAFLGKISRNIWQGQENIQFIIEDIADPAIIHHL